MWLICISTCSNKKSNNSWTLYTIKATEILLQTYSDTEMKLLIIHALLAAFVSVGIPSPSLTVPRRVSPAGTQSCNKQVVQILPSNCFIAVCPQEKMGENLKGMKMMWEYYILSEYTLPDGSQRCFYMRFNISIWGFVRPSVCASVHPVRP